VLRTVAADVMMQGVTIAEELAALGLFDGLGETDIAALAEVSFLRRLARGQVLFLAGEPSEHLCVVRSGLLRVVASSPHGEQFVLSNIAPGQTLRQNGRTARASALFKPFAATSARRIWGSIAARSFG